MSATSNVTRKARQSALGQFFTKAEASSALASFLDRKNGSVMVDLGAGDGRLSRSVSAVARFSRVVTVDVDENARPAIESTPHFHIHGDALDVELPHKLAQQHGLFDLAVCNPPYIKQAWRQEFSRIIQDAGLLDVCPAFPEARSEILFLAQLLRIIRSGGQVGVIVPDGPVTGERYKKLRRHLLSNHRVERVVSLPSGMFVGTEAIAHILILRKDLKPRRWVSLMQLDSNGSVSLPLSISVAAAEHRLDYAFHAAKVQPIHGRRTTLRELGAEVKRGTLSSNQCGREFSTFHTSDFPDHEERFGVCLRGPEPARSSIPQASPGDVLVARVGRNLEGKVCRVASGYAYVSDCVFRIRVPVQHSVRVYDALVSHRGRSYLRAVSRGVGARYLTVESILDFSI